MTVQITPAEAHVLKAIAYHEMNPGNGTRPESESDVYTFCWTSDFSPQDMNVSQTKGVLSSLVKKGLICIFEYDDTDKGVGFTKLGYEVFDKQVDPQP